MSEPPLNFRVRQRLSLQRDFERVFGCRCSAGDRWLVIYVDRNSLPYARIGFKVGRRLGGAVRRNRIRRRLREAFRLAQHGLPAGFDLICIPRTGDVATAGLDEIGRSMRKVVAQAVRRLERSHREDRTTEPRRSTTET